MVITPTASETASRFQASGLSLIVDHYHFPMKVVRLKVGVSVVKQLLKGGLANADPKGGGAKQQ